MGKSTQLIALLFTLIILLLGHTPVLALYSEKETPLVSQHPCYPYLNQQHKEICFPLPDYLEVGDLVFFDSTDPPGRWNVRGLDHVAMYIGDDIFIGTMRNTEKHKAEVNITNFTYFFTVLHFINPIFGRVVSATPEQRQASIAWTVSLIEDEYQTWDPQKVADLNSTRITVRKWYCSEIIWAAYYNYGIDIDKNGWARDLPWFLPLWSAVSCDDIATDNDVVILS